VKSALEPGRIYEMTIDLIGTANAFRKGPRIRVHITSSHFPQFDRNPNTGKPFGTSDEMKDRDADRLSFACPSVAHCASCDSEAVAGRCWFPRCTLRRRPVCAWRRLSAAEVTSFGPRRLATSDGCAHRPGSALRRTVDARF
jgi:hypothetical protein